MQPLQQALAELIGATVTRVSLDLWQVSCLLDDAYVVSEAAWRLENEAGEVLDQRQAPGERRDFQLWRLVGRTVQAAEYSEAPFGTLTLRFTGGLTWIVYGNADGYEDWDLIMGDKRTYICDGTL
jgi:hypothetical protein